MIVLLGQTTRDEITYPDGTRITRTGGSPIFAAEALVDAGIPARIVTRGGDATLQAPLLAAGLPVVIGPARTTFVSRLTLLPHGNRDHAIAALGTPFTVADMKGWAHRGIDDADTVVLGTQWRDDIPPETVAVLRRPGRRIVLDAQGLCRPSVGPVEPTGPFQRAWADGVDVLKCSDAEAVALFGGWSDHQLRAAGIPVIVVTEGEEGAHVWSITSAEVVHVPAERIDGLADTVGAGDMFTALFAAELDGGADMVAAAGRASAGVAKILRRRRDATTR